MKWNKFDHENPPKYTPGKATFWLIRFSTGDFYMAGAYLGDKGLLINTGVTYNTDVIISPKRLVLYNAHWIYPQDLEIPEAEE